MAGESSVHGVLQGGGDVHDSLLGGGSVHGSLLGGGSVHGSLPGEGSVHGSLPEEALFTAHYWVQVVGQGHSAGGSQARSGTGTGNGYLKRKWISLELDA